MTTSINAAANAYVNADTYLEENPREVAREVYIETGGNPVNFPEDWDEIVLIIMDITRNS